MLRLDLTLDDPAANLALDEVLLDRAEAEWQDEELLRLWELPRPAVILGRSSKVAEEVKQDRCRAAGIPILRRCSGGASVVLGPGCLVYSLVLSYHRRPECRAISQAHCVVMTTLRRALASLKLDIRFRGTCDLTLDNHKCSGNSLRCKRNYFLYHGTLLYDFSLDSIERLLKMPPRQPDYRVRRSHAEFVTNLDTRRDALQAAVATAWPREAATEIPQDAVTRLVERRYANDAWNLRR